jgi:aminocarboxymuconate-semialdehyde decarboxylase
MHIIDSHFHWRPISMLEWACKAKGYPRAERDGKGGYIWTIREGYSVGIRNNHPAWAPLDVMLADMDKLGHQIDVVCTIGPLSVYFSELPPEAGRDAAMLWNEEMAAATSSMTLRERPLRSIALCNFFCTTFIRS